jgi:hypothetical protein
MKKLSKLKPKTIFISCIVLVFAIAAGWLGINYVRTEPERVAASFVNDIAKTGNETAAYELTSSSYQNYVNYSTFLSDFQPLAKSEIGYTILASKTSGSLNVSGGTFKDLNGANYDYLINLAKISGKWQINSVFVTKE